MNHALTLTVNGQPVQQDVPAHLLLVDLLRDSNITRALIFTRTKHGADKVVKALDKESYKSAAIHGNKSQAARTQALAYVRGRWPVATLGSLASIASYGIALWAMTRAPVASVAALRETSVLFAALLGTWLLKEKFGRQRALGTLVVVLGVMALRLG